MQTAKKLRATLTLVCVLGLLGACAVEDDLAIDDDLVVEDDLVGDESTADSPLNPEAIAGDSPAQSASADDGRCSIIAGLTIGCDEDEICVPTACTTGNPPSCTGFCAPARCRGPICGW